MPIGTLEHCNITVSDPERSAAFLGKLCGWHERWRGPSQLGGWTIHCGNDDGYVALWTDGKGAEDFAKVSRSTTSGCWSTISKLRRRR